MERTTEKGKKQRRTENGEEASSLPYVMYGYLVLLFVGLPLYMQHGLDRIGDAKYLFFRNGTLACGAMLFLLFLWEKVTGRLPGAAGVKPLDRAVFLYFLSAILSFLLSPYRETAFWGYTDWHMGLVSQALFCGIYFSCRFFYREHKSIWVLAGTVAGIVMLLGVLNCLGADPLGIYAGMEEWEWNRQYLLSKIGNNNWYAGYVNCMAGILLAVMCRGKGIWRILGGVGSFLYFAASLTMGNLTGILAAMALALFLIILSLDSRTELLRALETVFLFPLAQVFLHLLEATGKGTTRMPGKLEKAIFYSNIWYVLLIMTGLLAVLLKSREKRGRQDFLKGKGYGKRLLLTVGIVMGLGVLIVIGILIKSAPESLAVSRPGDSLSTKILQGANGRLALWKGTLELFWDAPFLQKIFGAGPDCYYHVLYEQSNLGLDWKERGILEDTVYANAHNEWLNLLITQGLLGVAGYGGIFGAAVYSLGRNRKIQRQFAVLLCVIGYFVCSLFTFQQVLSTPFLFALLGMAEEKMEEGGDIAWS